MRQITKISAVLLLAANMVAAQSMEKAVTKLGEAGAKAYLQPIVTGFGSNLNAGWFQKAPPPVKRGFHISAGVSNSGTRLNSSKSLNVSGPMPLDTLITKTLLDNTTASPAQRDSLMRRLAALSPTVTLQGPSITGPEGETMKVIWSGRKVYTGVPGDSVFIPSDTVAIANLNGLLDGLATLTFFAPQINVGTLYGTNLTLRWLPQYEDREEIGPFDYFGFGFQHNPAVWLKPGQKIPVDLSIGFSRQTLEGTFFKATAWSTGLHVSKTYGWAFMSASPYVGAQYEKSTFEIEYDITADEHVEHIKTKVDGENSYRLTGGVAVRLLAITLNLDANYAQNPSYSLGVMIGL